MPMMTTSTSHDNIYDSHNNHKIGDNNDYDDKSDNNDSYHGYSDNDNYNYDDDSADIVADIIRWLDVCRPEKWPPWPGSDKQVESSLDRISKFRQQLRLRNFGPFLRSP